MREARKRRLIFSRREREGFLRTIKKGKKKLIIAKKINHSLREILAILLPF